MAVKNFNLHVPHHEQHIAISTSSFVASGCRRLSISPYMGRTSSHVKLGAGWLSLRSTCWLMETVVNGEQHGNDVVDTTHTFLTK